MIRPLLAALIAVWLLSSSAAFACSAPIPIEERIARSGADTVVLAEVERASYPGPQQLYQLWTGSVVLKRILKGRADAKVFPIGRSGQPTACDDGIPAPKPGDIWVLYLKDGEQLFFLNDGRGYPIDVARKADPDFDKLLASGDGK